MNSEPTTPHASLLPRILGPWMATALVIGTIIGSGVFKKASSVSDKVPEFGLAMSAWVLVGVLTMMGALALAEVAILLPRAGGNYVFLKEGYGRWAGFLWGWVEFWIIRSGSIAALSTVFTESVADILRQVQGEDVLSFWQRIIMTIIVITVLTLVNARGTRLGGGLQIVITTVKVSSLILVALLPIIIGALISGPRSAAVNTSYVSPAWPSDWGAVNWSLFGGALIGVFWAYHGWMNIAPVAEEVTHPSRNIPLSMVVGVLAIIVLYCTANAAYYFVIPREEMRKLTERTVVGEFAFRLLGPIGLILASTAVMISVFGALNGNLLVGPRLLFAMGRDGLAPRGLAALHPRYVTPARAGLVLSGWAISLVVIIGLMIQFRVPVLKIGSFELDVNLPPNKAPFDVVTDFAMFGAISFETLAVASLFVLRRRYPPSQVNLPYRCPLYPWMPIVYVATMAVILANMFKTQRSESLIGLGFMLVGAGFYFVFLRKMKPQKSTPASPPARVPNA